MGQYQTIKTQAGLGLEAGAETGGPAIKLVAMSVGDGNGQAVQPSAGQTGLVHEVDRVNLNSLSQNATDATQWVAEAVFPADHGGYTVREVGLWTDGGVLFAVANFPDTYKPAPSEGTAGQLLISLNFRAANSDNVTLVVDGSLQLATQDWVEEKYLPVHKPNAIGGLTIDGMSAVTVDDLQQERDRAIAAEGKLQPAGDYATNDALQREVNRATQAEQGCLKITGGTLSGSLHVNGSEGTFGPTIFAAKLATGFGDRPENSFLQTQVINEKPVTVIGYQGSAGGGWRNWIFDSSDGSITNPDDKRFAFEEYVDAERSRAQAAEAGLLPLSGGNLTGDLVLFGNTWGNALYGRTLRSKADNSKIEAALQLLGTRDNPVLSLRTVDDSGTWQQWSFNSETKNIVSPGGGVLPEALGFGGQRVVEQAFIVTGQSVVGNGESWVSFPTPFLAGQTPILSVTINREPGTSVSRSVALGNQGSQNQPNVTNTGFSFQAWYANGDDIHTSGQPWTLHVRALGAIQ